MQPQQELTGTEFHSLWEQDRNAAITLLFREYHTLVYSCVYRIVLRAEAADDLTQELFLLVIEGKRQLQTDGPLGSYLRRMAINLALDYLRKKRPIRLADVVEQPREGDALPADAALEAADLEQALHQAIQQLPGRCATIFVLSRFEALSYAEIAKELDISRNTVENQMVKALRLLRTSLKDFLPLLLAGALIP